MKREILQLALLSFKKMVRTSTKDHFVYFESHKLAMRKDSVLMQVEVSEGSSEGEGYLLYSDLKALLDNKRNFQEFKFQFLPERTIVTADDMSFDVMNYLTDPASDIQNFLDVLAPTRSADYSIGMLKVDDIFMDLTKYILRDDLRTNLSCISVEETKIVGCDAGILRVVDTEYKRAKGCLLSYKLIPYLWKTDYEIFSALVDAEQQGSNLKKQLITLESDGILLSVYDDAGRYPDYKAVTPENPPLVLGADTKKLAQIVVDGIKEIKESGFKKVHSEDKTALLLEIDKYYKTAVTIATYTHLPEMGQESWKKYTKTALDVELKDTTGKIENIFLIALSLDYMAIILKSLMLDGDSVTYIGLTSPVRAALMNEVVIMPTHYNP
jgi:hypothetical protein